MYGSQHGYVKSAYIIQFSDSEPYPNGKPTSSLLRFKLKPSSNMVSQVANGTLVPGKNQQGHIALLNKKGFEWCVTDVTFFFLNT